MGSDPDLPRLPSSESEVNVDQWHIGARHSRIMASACDESCTADSPCQLCQFRNQLQFPHMPDMVFPDNVLYLEYKDGGKIEFTALEAMKCIDINRAPVQVACAEEWQESRSGTDQKVSPFDWTYISDYKGTILNGFELVPTTETINMELLKKKEKILFYEDIPLYEDELHDHGISSCSVKIRVMPSCWFILLRYFLRVDDVLSEISDTRMFYEFDKPHILFEHTTRKGNLADLKLSPHIVTNPNELSQHLPITSQTLSKIVLPKKE